jgi:hypothetical protein
MYDGAELVLRPGVRFFRHSRFQTEYAEDKDLECLGL